MDKIDPLLSYPDFLAGDIRDALLDINQGNQELNKKLVQQGEKICMSEDSSENINYSLNKSNSILNNMLSNISYYLWFLKPSYWFNNDKIPKNREDDKNLNDINIVSEKKERLYSDNNEELFDGDEQKTSYNYQKITDSNGNECHLYNAEINEIIMKIKRDTITTGEILDQQNEQLGKLETQVDNSDIIMESNQKKINKLLK